MAQAPDEGGRFDQREAAACNLTIIIKTLNEEVGISRAIESALAAAAPYDGEVIVADSGSTDRTLAIALEYPIKVVQLGRVQERRCGIGPQLGFQHCRGKYIYLLDGDMELDATFVGEAIDLLERDQSIAGVGGIVEEKVFANVEFRNRARHFVSRRVEHGAVVDCLTGGGLYRRSAVDSVAYLSDRNLHGFEEYDLGARLRSKGWRLVRLEAHAVNHFSHQMGTYALLWFRLRAGRLLAIGEILRAAIDAGYLGKATVELRPIRFALAMWVYWPVVSLAAFAARSGISPTATLTAAALLPVVAMAVRTKSINAGIYSVVVWHLTSINCLLGFIRRRVEPNRPISSVVLHGRPIDRQIDAQADRQIDPQADRQIDSQAKSGCRATAAAGNA
jgi:glycosyltransferase involved in cell wall biosynthesis